MRNTLFILTILIFNILTVNGQNIDNSTQLNLSLDKYGNSIPCGEIENRRFKKEFSLNNKDSISYEIEIIENSYTILHKRIQDKVIHDTLELETSLLENNGNLCDILCPSFNVEDFDNDGYNDLVYWQSTNVNGNIWTIIFLYNKENRNLEILENDDAGKIWAAPSFDKKTNILTSEEVCGQFGIHFISKYKLINKTAKPISKIETDSTNFNPIKGTGIEVKEYIGNNGWELYKRNGKLVKKKK